MTNTSYERLFDRLQDALLKINGQNLPQLGQLSASLETIRSFLKKLREQVTSQPFTDHKQEIAFFKTVKPRFYSELIFHIEIYNLLFHLPAGTREMQKEYFLEELKQLDRFFRLNAFYYQYYRSGVTELDHLYFVRGGGIENGYIPEPAGSDSAFSTALDYLFSKFIAYERMQEYIIQKLSEGSEVSLKRSVKAKVRRCTWTGNKVNLVELAYGLYYSGEINHGEVEVQEIIALLEGVFNISIGDGHRKFVDIRSRKNVSPTQLLDKMRAAILQRIEEDMVYRANRGIRLRKPIGDGKS